MRNFALLLVFCGMTIPAFSQDIDLMMQAWYWDYFQGANFGNWVNTLNGQAADMKDAGFKHIWLPPLPRSSTSNNQSNGYNPQDLYDFGQYSGDCAWGSRAELNALISTYNSLGMEAVSDVVYNHRDGGRPERNDAVKYFITSPSNTPPYPSDRFFCVLPIGANNPGGYGAGDYHIRVKSKTNGYNNYHYKFYAKTTLTTTYLPLIPEAEPNGGDLCAQASNPYTLGRDIDATLYDYSGCYIDDYMVTLNPGDFNAADDTIFIYLTNYNSGYSDHYIYQVNKKPENIDITDKVEYWTYTDFSNQASGQGAGNYNDFRPNDNTANAGAVTETLGCWWNCPLFFYDYDQSQSSTINLLNAWTQWQLGAVGIGGLRMDAVKHFDPAFVGQLMNYLVANGTVPNMVVGENFDSDPGTLVNWVNSVESNMDANAQAAIHVRAFDFSMREALKNACDSYGYDVRNVFQKGIVNGGGGSGYNSVTFINNHDFRGAGEPVQNNPILAYAYILTNNQIGAPCVFYPDYYGIAVPNAPTNTLKPQIDALVQVHKDYIYGSPAIDYLSRFSTPYYQYFVPNPSGGSFGYPNTSLVYQMKAPTPSGTPNVIVAINFAGVPMDMYQGINTSWGANAGSVFTDVIGNAGGGNTNITNNKEIHVTIPARSYTVYVQNLAPLPIELLDFTAHTKGNAILLNWKTSSESDLDRFEVERSIGVETQFQLIGSEAAENKPSGAEYSMADAHAPLNVDLYYRLKIVHRDGSLEYSPIRNARLGNTGLQIKLLPNPSALDAQLWVESESEQSVQIEAVNQLGQSIWSVKTQLNKGQQEFTLPAAHWPADNYSILITSENNQKITRFTKL